MVNKLHFTSLRQTKDIINLFLLGFSFVILSFSPQNNFAQKTIQSDTIKVDSSKAVNLGLFTKENKQTLGILFSGKPAKAGLYSLIFPGAGQIYNKQYYSVPIVWGLIGYFGYRAYVANKDYCEINRVYHCMIDGGTCDYKDLGYTRATELAPYRKQLKSKADKNWVTFSVLYLFQAIYSYIQRHLIDFDLDEDLTVKPTVSPTQGGFGIGLSMNISSK